PCPSYSRDCVSNLRITCLLLFCSLGFLSLGGWQARPSYCRHAETCISTTIGLKRLWVGSLPIITLFMACQDTPTCSPVSINSGVTAPTSQNSCKHCWLPEPHAFLIR